MPLFCWLNVVALATKLQRTTVMQTNPMAYLSEMGIDTYQLAHPQRLVGYQAAPLVLPAECKMLFISPELPQNQLAEFLARVLKSMQLDLAQVRHIYPEQIPQLQATNIEWVWFAGCPKNDAIAAKVLVSPLLKEIDGNNEQRKSLWQQICSYS